MRMRTPRLALAALAATALVAAGCGGDDDDAAEPAATSAAAAATTAADSAPAASSDAAMATDAAATGTIVDIAAGNPDFSILVAAVTKAGLAETLSGPGPFTVFAPTNAAFEQALTDLGLTQDELLASPDLAAILTYHVLPAAVMAADITGPSEQTTVQGEALAVAPEDGAVKVGDATVTQADLVASNGVIHVIDRVLLPPTVAAALAS